MSPLVDFLRHISGDADDPAMMNVHVVHVYGADVIFGLKKM